MKMIDDRTINAILDLCRFTLTDAERTRFAGQIGEILDYVGTLESVDTGGADPDLGKTQPPSAFREDASRPGLPRSELETLAPWFTDGHFQVPQIIEDAEERGTGR